MLILLTIVIMLVCGYALYREGLFAAALMFLNVLLAGILTFEFFEPLADEVELLLPDFMVGYEDLLSMAFLFAGTLGILKALTTKMAPTTVRFSNTVQQVGGGLFGLLTGYFVAGFLVCMMQTLPWHEHFLNFKPRVENEPRSRRLLPPDRLWLALMRTLGSYTLSWRDDNREAEDPYDRYGTFDAAGTFELRYNRYRRYGDKREPLRYEGEFDRELGKRK